MLLNIIVIDYRTHFCDTPQTEKFRFWKPADFTNDYKLHTYRPHLGTDASYEFVVPAKMVRITDKREWNYSHDPPPAADKSPQCPWLNVDDGGKLTKNRTCERLRACFMFHTCVSSVITNACKPN